MEYTTFYKHNLLENTSIHKLFSPFFCEMFLLPTESLQRKETKLVLF